MLTALVAISAVEFVGLMILAWQQRQLQLRFRQALTTESGSLEHNLTKYHQQVKAVDVKLGQLTEAYQKLSDMAGMASQKISVVRFNPFGDTGGDQSFVLAVLDAHDSGYILTSIHGREGTRVYIKPIDYGQSKYTLSKEEQQAIKQASERVPA